MRYCKELDKWMTKNKLKGIVKKYPVNISLTRMFIFYKLYLKAIILSQNEECIFWNDLFNYKFRVDIFLYEHYISNKERYKNELKANNYNIFISEMEAFYTKYLVSDYMKSGKSKNRGYDLLLELKIRTCPYCNRNYTFSINKNNRKTRPEFDHFYPKSKYPLLALSFYNLVPSCHICNHLKGEKSIGISPYDRKFSDTTTFKIYENKSVVSLTPSTKIMEDQFDIQLDSNCVDEKKNIEVFALNELYSEHKDYIQEILDKTQSYNDTALKSLRDSFQTPIYSQSQVYNYVWGKYLEDAEHEKRPLSKLTKDLLDQLNIKRR